MIGALYTLSRQFENKKIYIWNVNRDSMLVFTKAVFRKIDIQGFVTLEKEYVGEFLFNRPIKYIKQVEEEKDSIIIVSDSIPRKFLEKVHSAKIVYWSEVLEVNQEIGQKKVIVYGIGKGADQLCDTLDHSGIEVDNYCVTQLSSVTQFRNKEIIEANDLERFSGYDIIISVITEQYMWEILERISDFKGTIYLDVEYIIGTLDIIHLNLIQNLDFAIKNGKKIYLYGKRDVLAGFIEDALIVYGIKINGYVYDTENKDENIQSIYSLAYGGDQTDKILIMNIFHQNQIIKARENIEFAGFSLEQRNYTGMKWYIRASEKVLLNEYQEEVDSLVSASISYPNGKPGWKIYGREETNRIRIVVVGGSTSSEVYAPENWISKLYYKLSLQNIKTTIYNGAHPANDIVMELLRLLRDGNVLQPQIVISMSGVNNLYYKECENQFNVERFLQRWNKKSHNGVCSSESLYSFWSRNERLMECIANFYGAQFFGFLQPMNFTMEHMNLHEKSLYEMDTRIVGAKDFSNYANNDDGYFNLMRLFEHKDDMFFDICHYTDRGHKIIADKVYEIIKPTIMELIRAEG